MNSSYVPAPEAIRKLREARKSHKTVFIFGATGYGKTRLVKEYLDFHNYIYIDCQNVDWSFDLIPPSPQRQRAYVVVDNLQFMDRDRETELENILKRNDLWLVLISRSPVATWSLGLYAEDKLFAISEKDLALGAEQVVEIAQNRGVALTREQAVTISDSCGGNAFKIVLMLRLVQDRGYQIDEALYETVDRMFTEHIEHTVLKHWSPEILQFLLSMCIVDKFDQELAEVITGDTDVVRIIKNASKLGNFLRLNNGIYEIRPAFLNMLRRYLERTFDKAQKRLLYHSAGRYFELHDDFITALQLYEVGDCRDEIKNLLIRNARRNTMAGNFWEFKDYYLALPDDLVINSVPLMRALCVVNAMLMNRAEAQRWYEALHEYAQTYEGGARRDALSQIAYIDIGRAADGTGSVNDAIHRAAELLRRREIELTRIPITNNRGSVLNGSLDLCRWIKNDDDIDISFEDLELVSGVPEDIMRALIKCEVAFERGDDYYDVMEYLSYAQSRLEGTNMVDLLFVCSTIQATLAMFVGETDKAVTIMKSYRDRVRESGNVKLGKSLIIAWLKLALRFHDVDEIKRLVAAAPDEDAEFCFLDRHTYLMKTAGYLALGKNYEAGMLISRLRVFAENSNRVTTMLFLDMFSAIVKYRLGDEEAWHQSIISVLRTGQEYGFVRTIAAEGAAILPLLKQIEGSVDTYGIDRDYFERVMREVENIAKLYPDYLGATESIKTNFSDSAIAILKLQADGRKIKEIADMLHLSESTIKYHCSETYRKLEVKGKTAAIQKAKEYGLI